MGYSRDELLNRLKQVSVKLGKPMIARSEFVRETGITEYHILKHFDSWNDFVGAAGLNPDIRNRRIDDDLLFEAMYVVLNKDGVLPRSKFRNECEYSVGSYEKRWGSWTNSLIEFGKWAKTNRPDFKFFESLPNANQKLHSQIQNRQNSSPATSTYSWQKTDGRIYGSILNFRGLQHSPINEQGVVFLFGMVAQELGFIVESVARGYPDCEAKRCVDKNQNFLQKTRIEFEYQSRNFRDHGHNPNGCDLIVCWENNWPECPVEVLELRQEIQKLPLELSGKKEKA